jgi:hypothetical protein
MLYLKQSTASQAILLGPFVDDTDGATAETGLTIANTDVRLSKNGGNMAAKASGGGTHDENGWYTITLDATDTNTVGRLQISCKVSGALTVLMEANVLEEAVYVKTFASGATGVDADWTNAGRLDALLDAIKVPTDKMAFTVSNQLDSNALSVGGTTQTGGDIVAAVITNAVGTDVAADIIALKAETVLIVADTNEMQADWANGGRLDLIQDIIAADTTTDIPALIATAQADLDTITGASGVNLLTATQASIDAIVADTNEMQTDWANGGRLDLIQDIIAADTTTDIPALIATAQADLDIITGVSGVKLLTATQASIDAIETDTGTTLQAELDAIQAAVITNAAGDDIAADIIAMKSETALIVADTNELQTDDVPGLISTLTADLLDKLGAVDEAAAAGDPSATESVMQYVKQIVNILAGATGVTTMPTAAVPANGVSIAEMLRQVYDNLVVADTAIDAIPTKAEMDTAHALLATPAQVNTQVDLAFTTQMADSVPADGTISTREQALYAILQLLTEFAYSGTTMTVYKVDGTTQLMTLTLSDDTNPTSLHRAT